MHDDLDIPEFLKVSNRVQVIASQITTKPVEKVIDEIVEATEPVCLGMDEIVTEPVDLTIEIKAMAVSAYLNYLIWLKQQVETELPTLSAPARPTDRPAQSTSQSQSVSKPPEAARAPAQSTSATMPFFDPTEARTFVSVGKPGEEPAPSLDRSVRPIAPFLPAFLAAPTTSSPARSTAPTARSVGKQDGRGHHYAGKIWMLNRKTGERARIAPNELEQFKARGFVCAGPRSK